MCHRVAAARRSFETLKPTIQRAAHAEQGDEYIAVYHMGIYADPALLEWFQAEYAKHSVGKPDLGKSCIRFRKPDRIPMTLIGELASKVTPKRWIEVYERNMRR